MHKAYFIAFDLAKNECVWNHKGKLLNQPFSDPIDAILREQHGHSSAIFCFNALENRSPARSTPPSAYLKVQCVEGGLLQSNQEGLLETAEITQGFCTDTLKMLEHFFLVLQSVSKNEELPNEIKRTHILNQDLFFPGGYNPRVDNEKYNELLNDFKHSLRAFKEKDERTYVGKRGEIQFSEREKTSSLVYEVPQKGEVVFPVSPFPLEHTQKLFNMGDQSYAVLHKTDNNLLLHPMAKFFEFQVSQKKIKAEQ